MKSKKCCEISHYGLYNKHILNVNYDSSIINKFGASLTDDARVIIYDCHMFIVQGTGRKRSSFLSHLGRKKSLTTPVPQVRVLDELVEVGGDETLERVADENELEHLVQPLVVGVNLGRGLVRPRKL